MEKTKIMAIVLAAGHGKRMNSSTHKQYMLLDEKPLIYYALSAFDNSRVDEVVLVTGEDEIDFCRKEIVEKYHIEKVKQIVAGGKERYHSVYEGLKVCEGADYVLIHDGARPFLNNDIIERTIEEVKKEKACVVGMPVKDTIKLADDSLHSTITPPRKDVWMIQTPQAFSYDLIYEAYRKIIEEKVTDVTDDAMVLEKAYGQSVKMVYGSYCNIKITTPEDMEIAKTFLKMGL